MHTKKVNECAITSEQSVFESRIVMSYPRCGYAYRYKRVFRVAVNTYLPIFRGLQTCNGEYTKHCMWSRHQLKMASPAEMRKRRSNFQIRQFYLKKH